MQQVKIGGHTYEAIILGTAKDASWGGRNSKSITLEMDYATAIETFGDDVPWSIFY